MSDKIFTPLGARNYARGARQPEDFYSTDPLAVKALLEREIFYPDILEPCCGSGAMSKVLEDAGYTVTSSDKYTRGYGIKKDFFDYSYWHGDIVTNPPYKKALECVKHALDITAPDAKVAMFLRLLFLEGQARKKFFDEFPPTKVYVFSKRVRCYKDGNTKDSKDKNNSAIAFAWFVWDKTVQNNQTLLKWI